MLIYSSITYLHTESVSTDFSSMCVIICPGFVLNDADFDFLGELFDLSNLRGCSSNLKYTNIFLSILN